MENDELLIIQTPNGEARAELLAVFEVGDESNSREYIALIPSMYLDGTEYENKEIVIFRRGEVEGANTILCGIESDEEYEEASNALAALLEQFEQEEADE